MANYAIEMLGITKTFNGGKIIANDDVTLQVKQGEIHALLGENGAGKSTLMSVLFGLYDQDKGDILVNGKKSNITSPLVANAEGIGMVHQHFKLVNAFTVLENVMLGAEDVNTELEIVPTNEHGKVRGIFSSIKNWFGALLCMNSENKVKHGKVVKKNTSNKGGPLLNKSAARKKLVELSKKYNLNIDPDAKIKDISVGMQQRVEIIKMLWRDANILIFDEPTAVLTPQEIDELLEIIKGFKKAGKSIIIITHKLNEIKAVADTCTILRRGKQVGVTTVADKTEQELATLMVGRDVTFEITKDAPKVGETKLQLNGVSGKNLKDVSLELRAGEIVTIAGVEGSGQSELFKAIIGWNKVDGEILINGENMSQCSTSERLLAGIAHIPEDRHHEGLVLDMNLWENILLSNQFNGKYKKSLTVNTAAVKEDTREIINKFDVRNAEDLSVNVRGLSGGNQQKLIIGRELTYSQNIILAYTPTRGLDVGAIEYIHDQLIKARDNGAAVLVVSYELDEVIGLADRILVFNSGEMVKELDPKTTDEHEIGLYMTNKEAK